MAHSSISDPTVSESTWSISYGQLMELDRNAAAQFRENYSSMTMRDINREIIEPSCRRTGKSYALTLNPQGRKVDAFITHSWDEPFQDFVHSIRMVFQTFFDKPNLWICAFALMQGDEQTIQAQVGGKDTPLEESPFVKALESASTFVVVRNSATDLYSRIWCVCELIYAKQLGLYPSKTFVTGPDKFADSRTSCMDAMSSNKHDKAKILKMLLIKYEIDGIVQQFRMHEAPFVPSSAAFTSFVPSPPPPKPSTARPSSQASAPSPYVVPQHAPASASHTPSAPSLPSRPPSTTVPSFSVVKNAAASAPPVSSSAMAMAASSPPREERCEVGWRGWGTYRGQFNGRGERDGWGTMTWDNRYAYEGEWKRGKFDGRGTLCWSKGSVVVSRWRAGDQVGEGVIWSADRRTATRWEGYVQKEEISLRRAEEIAERIGLPVPK